MSNRACFAVAQPEPRTIYLQPQGPTQGNAQVQTQQVSGHCVAVGTNFGPMKPPRSHANSREELNTLLGNETPDAAANLEILLSADELNVWCEEGGDMSKATSLSSLDTQVSDKDWEMTLRSFGPKFACLADMVSAHSDNSSGGNPEGSEV